MPYNRVLGTVCLKLGNAPLIFLTFIVFVLQASLLDYLLIAYRGGTTLPDDFPGCASRNPNCTAAADAAFNPVCVDNSPNLWHLLILGDVITALLLVTTAGMFLCSTKCSSGKRKHCISNFIETLPTSCVAWTVYSVLLSVKVAIIFWSGLAECLSEESGYGPNLLKATISVTSVVFLLFVWTHHSLPSQNEAETNNFITLMANGVTFDLLDSADALDVLFIQEDLLILPFSMTKVILAIACINLIRPLLSFVILHFLHSKKRRVGGLKVFNAFVYVFLVNLPFMCIRMLLWHWYSRNISVFLVKNFIMLFIGLKEILEECLEGIERKYLNRRAVAVEGIPLSDIRGRD